MIVVAAFMAAVMTATTVAAVPATAASQLGSGSGGTPQLGQPLGSHWRTTPDGKVQVTEFEAGTTVSGTLASCSVTATMYRPWRSGSRIYGRATWSVLGCSITFNLTATISVVSIDYVPVKRGGGLYRAPVSGVISLSTKCRSDAYATTLSLDGPGLSDFKASAVTTIKC